MFHKEKETARKNLNCKPPLPCPAPFALERNVSFGVFQPKELSKASRMSYNMIKGGGGAGEGVLVRRLTSGEGKLET